MSMATIMSEMPDVLRRVLAEHVTDDTGQCRTCVDEHGNTASWPCQTYRIALEAQWVGGGSASGTGLRGPVVPVLPGIPGGRRQRLDETGEQVVSTVASLRPRHAAV